MVEIVDLAAVAAAAHDRGIAVFVDNTFATPVVQRPLKLGADLVMHSLSKALGGHSDIIGGALVGSRARIDKAHALLKVLGGCIDPHTAFLVERGLKTVHLRVQRQCENAMALATRLEKHPKIRRVVYPGLASHPGHEVARRQMSAFGGIVAFVLAGGLPAAEKFYDAPAARVAGGQPGGRRVADQPARAHVPLRVQRRAARGGRGRPGRGADLPRGRGRGGHHRRRRARAGVRPRRLIPMSPRNETMLTVVLVGVGVYFSVLLARDLAGYLRFRRLRSTALLTWPVRRSIALRAGAGRGEPGGGDPQHAR